METTLVSSHASSIPSVWERTKPISYTPGYVLAGKYQLKRRVDVDGPRARWIAHDVFDPVTIEILRPDDPSATARLVRETRALIDIDHPGMGRVLDCGATHDGDVFLVTELVCGETLRERLDSVGRLPPIPAVRRLLPVLGALASAHAAGILHGDVRPENVFLPADPSGRASAKLFGFGAAPILGDRASPRRLEYQSPERARGLDIDPRAELWSFAVTLYEAIAGERPFHGVNQATLLRQLSHQVAPSLPDAGLIDELLWSVLSRGLATRRDERWPSARSFGSALSQWLAGSVAASRPGGEVFVF